MHCLTLPVHPFLDIPTKECRLDVLTKEKENKISGYLNYIINLFFDNERQANLYFEELALLYESLSLVKTKGAKADKQFAIYKQDNNAGWLNQVELLLTTGDMYDQTYKIIAGTILDLEFEEYYGSQHRYC